MTGNPLVGYDADTLARMKASDDNLAGIVAGRRRAATALLATDGTPARMTREGWAALSKPGAPLPSPLLPPAPPLPEPGEGNDEPTTWTGNGPPTMDLEEYEVGDWYYDLDSGDLYELTGD